MCQANSRDKSSQTDSYSRWTNYSNPGQLYPPRPPNFKVVFFFQGLRRVDKTNQTPQHDIKRTRSLTLTFGEGGVVQSCLQLVHCWEVLRDPRSMSMSKRSPSVIEPLDGMWWCNKKQKFNNELDVYSTYVIIPFFLHKMLASHRQPTFRDRRWTKYSNLEESAAFFQRLFAWLATWLCFHRAFFTRRANRLCFYKDSCY